VADEPELAFSPLPEDLRHLEPLIPKYAESDDVLRSNLLEQATDDELRELVAAADPHWPAINAFLDANTLLIGPRQDLAVALDSVAQAAMEAVYELERREPK
jgi:hypothetical protein